MRKSRPFRFSRFALWTLLLTTVFLLLPIKSSGIARKTIQDQFNFRMITVVHLFGDVVQDPDSPHVSAEFLQWYEWHITSLVSTGFFEIVEHRLNNIDAKDYFDKYIRIFKPNTFDFGFYHDSAGKLVARVRCRPQDVKAWEKYFEKIDNDLNIPADQPQM